MIEFKSNLYGKCKDGTCYISDKEIEEWTELIIEDYDKSYFTEPRLFDYERFLYDYLNVDNIDYRDIYSEDGQEIMGCAIFNKQPLKIIDEESGCLDAIVYNPNTVVIGNVVMEGSRKIQENFTGMHEGGHLWMHKNVYSQMEGQKTIYKTGIAVCRTQDVLRNKKRSLTPDEMKEHQANVFASRLMMPKKSLEIVMDDLFRKYGITDNQLVYDEPSLKDIANHKIPQELKNIYGISKQSAVIRLKSLEYYITKEMYIQDKKQLTIFDIK